MLLLRHWAVLGTFSAVVWAQNPTASFTGRITDPAAAAIPGAVVQALNLDTNQRREARSGGDGNYVIPNLNPGRYRFEVSFEGFRSYRRPELSLDTDQQMRLDVTLQVGASTESVTVTDSAPVVNTENGSRGDVTSNQELTEMPLAGRNFADLALLSGGVLPKAEDTDGAFAINGARSDNVGFVLDGVNNTQRRNTGSMVSPPVEGIQEFKMITSGFAAEYGRFAGGVLSVVLKSGGNRLRGSLYEFTRNDFFDARNFFDLEKSKLRRHQFGATVNGPVRIPKLYNGRDKTFFLFSWESIRQIQGGTRRTQTPLPEFLRGDFSQAVDAFNRPLAITDPLNRNTPFPNKQIPATRLDPVAAKLGKFYPSPTRPGLLNNFISQANANNNSDNFTAKIDHTFSPRDMFSGRTVWRPNASFDPFNRSFIPFFGATTANFEILSALRYTRTLAANKILELNASFSRRTNNQGFPDNSNTNWQELTGFLGGTLNPVAVGAPQIEVTGYTILGHAYDLPKIWSYNNYQYGGVYTWIRGAHSVKAGGDFLRAQYFSRNYGDTRGRVTFLGRFTQDPMADFVLGYAQTTRRQLDAAGPYHLVSSYSGFLQDDWKVTPSLTLNLGLRYELQKPPQEKFGAWSMFSQSLAKVVIASTGNLTQAEFDRRILEGGLTNSVLLADRAGLPRTLVKTDYTDFAPRFGFAWRPFGDAKGVVRGGYGLFYGASSLYRLDELSDIYPFSINETYSAVSSNPTLLTLSSPYPESRRRVGGITSTSGQEENPQSQYLQSWNLTLERDLGKGSAIELAYAGSKGTHLPRRYDINQPFRDPALRQADGTFPRPYGNVFQNINFISAASNSTYNSATLAFRRRFSKALFIRASYVYAKSIDESSQTGGSPKGGFSSAQDARNLKLERGRSDFDLGHTFTAAFVLQPKLTKNYLLKDWQMSGTSRAYTGQPFTARVANYSLDLGDAIRPDRIAKGNVPNPNADQWFDRTAFPVVPRGTYRFGNAGRNVLDGPGLLQLDLSLSRRFRLPRWESSAVQFRWEVFNVPNRTNLNLPENNVDVINGGTIIRAKTARVHQLALRWEF